MRSLLLLLLLLLLTRRLRKEAGLGPVHLVAVALGELDTMWLLLQRLLRRGRSIRLLIGYERFVEEMDW